MTNCWTNSGVKLHFPVYYPIWVILTNLVNNEMDFVEIGVFTTGTIGGVGEHGDDRLLVGEFRKSFGSVFNNAIQLFVSGLFIDAAIGEGEELVAFLADKATGEEFGCHWDFIFAS